MPEKHLVDPVHDDAVPRVNNAISVGEDLAFQERWWKFEHIIWTIFLLILVADVLGVFGRGWLAKAERKQPGSGMEVTYERVERNGTSSIMQIQFGPDAVQNGQAHLFASESVVKELGAERVIPQPTQSVLGNNGITYTFPINGGGPAVVQIELKPSMPGIFHWTLQVPGKDPVGARVVVMP